MKRSGWTILIGFCVFGGLLQAVLAQTKPGVGLSSVDIADSERQLGLIWHTSIVPGEEVMIVRNTIRRYEETFYSRYQFAGVVGNSLQINQTGGSQSKGATSAQESSRMAKTFYIERAPDGGFYFVPEDLKDVGTFRIQRSEQDPGIYLVTFNRRKQQAGWLEPKGAAR